MVQKTLAVVAIVVSTFTLGCSTKSSGGGTPGAAQQGGGQGGQQGGGARAESLCVAQMQNSNVILCQSYSSNELSVAQLEQECTRQNGQVAAECPGTNVVLTCLIRYEHAENIVRAIGTPDQRQQLAQLCANNGGTVQ